MAAFRLSRDAFQDIKVIHRYSLRNFGEARANRYAIDLQACLALLAANPLLGRDFGKVRAGLRRHEHQSHVIYYRQDQDNILILRILGADQDPGRHL